MKQFLTILSLFLASATISYAQNPVVDKYPEATIYVIDPQTGEEVLAQNDDAILFKDAYIDLVKGTNRVKMTIKSPGHKTLVVTQSDPADGNAFQITSQSKFLGQQITNYTFSYNVDQNTLYYFDQTEQQWYPEVVQGANVVNLNNCLALGKFNEVQADDNNGGDNGDYADAADEAGDDGVTADAPPPALQDYEQPECPQDDYLWQPGYWAFSPAGGYYWVAGEWVAPPSEGLLWTPPYWGYEGARYVFHAGYWGSDIGFYGGVDYGYGYGGTGFVGGRWYGGHFRYNTAVVRVGGRIRNVYVDRSVVRVGVRIKISFNGGNGLKARPSEHEINAGREKHIRDNHQNPRAVNHNNGNGHNKGNNNNNGNHNNGNGQNGNHNNGNGQGNNHNNAPGQNGNNGNGQGNNHNNAPGQNGNNGGGNNHNNTPGQNGNNGGPKTPGNAPGNGSGAPRGTGNGAPKGPGSGPAVPKGPGVPRGPGHNGGQNNGGNNNGGQKNGDQKKGGGKDKGGDKQNKPARKNKKDGDQ